MEQGDVSALPFEDEKFDLATAFETVYFWPDLGGSFREVFRVLKPGGRFHLQREQWRHGQGRKVGEDHRRHDHLQGY